MTLIILHSGTRFPILGNLRFLLAILFISSSLLVSSASASKEFPLYKSIEPNVRFWEAIYQTYPSNKGVLHDKNDLSRIYTVIDLVEWHTPGASKINREMIRLARERYKSILTSLGQGNKPRTKDEKRVAALFPKQRHTTYLKAKDHIRLQIGQKDHFHEGVIRAGKYIGPMKKIFASYGLPTDLAYLPHVESSFNPKAYSKAGAAGPWQFTRSTGKQYMAINSVVDERYDPLLATHAAAKLLKENYSQLGTWPLALTAYNYGRAGMVRAVNKKDTYVNIFNTYQEGFFKFASRNFYSEFLAARKVAKKLEKNPKVIVDRPEGMVTIRLKGYTSASAVRSYFKVSEKDFARLNPALKKQALNGSKHIPKGYHLRLPATKLVRAKKKTMGTRLYHNSQLPDRYHTVKSGDTLGKIARKYKIKIKDLKDANQLNKSLTIRVGQKLTLPGKGGNIVVLNANSKKKP